jgi:hypothetical protein
LYLLFKSVDERKLGPVQKMGYWMDFMVGFIPDTHVDIIPYEHLAPTRILESEGVANAWMFMDGYRGFISVRSQTDQNDALQVLSSGEELGVKSQYDLTDTDISNTVTFMKHIMRLRLDEVYDKRLVQQMMQVSTLEHDSWAEQLTEAKAYQADNTASVPMIQALATARGITLAAMVTKVINATTAYNTKVQELLSAKQLVETEIKSCTTISQCCLLLHNRFDVHISLAQAESEGITSDPAFNI